MTLRDLPALNASLNALCAILLGFAFYYIRRGKIIQHRRCMIAALTVSALFLISYLTYHFTVKGVTRFREPTWFKPIYLTLLLTHTVLAAIILPLIAVTLTRALKTRYDLHKKIARWTWPIWMYVSITGVLVYLLLYKIFPQAR
jgi:putative membrane protein